MTPPADPQAAPRVDCACGPVRRLRPPRRARPLQHPPRGRRPHALQEPHRCSGKEGVIVFGGESMYEVHTFIFQLNYVLSPFNNRSCLTEKQKGC